MGMPHRQRDVSATVKGMAKPFSDQWRGKQYSAPYPSLQYTIKKKATI